MVPHKLFPHIILVILNCLEKALDLRIVDLQNSLNRRIIALQNTLTYQQIGQEKGLNVPHASLQNGVALLLYLQKGTNLLKRLMYLMVQAQYRVLTILLLVLQTLRLIPLPGLWN